jgi:hypothetical protein
LNLEQEYKGEIRMKTTADEKLDEAVESLKKAKVALGAVISGDLWGCDEFSGESLASFEEAFCEISNGLRRLT